MKEIQGKDRVLLGTNSDGESIYITKPKWDCDWYWSFGYLGNRNCHFHLNSYQTKDHSLKLADGSHKFIAEQRNKCMYDCLLEDYQLTEKIKQNLWTFCELAETIYALEEAAEVLGRGGSHMTTNPCAEIIKNPTEVERLNNVVIPQLCQTFWNLIGGND